MGCTLSSENPNQPNEPRQQMTKGRNVSSPRAELPSKCCVGTYSQRVDCTQRWAWLDSHEVALGLGIVLKNTFLSSYNLGKDLLWHKSPLFIFFFLCKLSPCWCMWLSCFQWLWAVLFSPRHSQKPRVWAGPIWNAGGMFPHLPAQQQLQSTDVSLQDWLHPGEWRQVMQKYVI